MAISFSLAVKIQINIKDTWNKDEWNYSFESVSQIANYKIKKTELFMTEQWTGGWEMV